MSISPRQYPEGFVPLPGLDALDAVEITTASSAQVDIRVVCIAAGAAVPDALEVSAEQLTQAGFEGKTGQSLLLPGAGVVLVGIGDGEVTANAWRDAAAAGVRAAAKAAAVAIEVPSGAAAPVITAVVEGALLARYRYTAFKNESTHVGLTRLALVGVADADAAVAAALVGVRAAVVARDLANTPPGHLGAPDIADVAVTLGKRFGFDVEVFDKSAIEELGCGGLLGVNRGSVVEPRIVKLSYSPAGGANGHLGLVGKGIMYDSGGISLKPSDPMHLLMKMDMAGAAAVLGAFVSLADRGVAAQVTGWLMCTDNMPSGSATKLGDILIARGGTTIEVKNTDAEGRLVLCDGIVLANEAKVDAIIDIATLTGAALMALGPSTAAYFANDDAVAALVADAAAAVDEPAWRLPIEPKYRKQLDSDIADISNMGGKFAGATTAALFLQHFVGETPWAHLDIAGTMNVDKDESWRTTGATGYGARLLLEAAAHYSK